MERIGTQVTAGVVIQSTDIPSASGFSNLTAGGMFHKDTLADMLAIPEYYRYDKYIDGQVVALWGMKCYVHSDTTPENNGEWELIKGVSSTDIMDNGNWRRSQQGSISANDVIETPERVFLTPAEKERINNDKGHQPTYEALVAEYPVGKSGWYAVVETTNTFWIWSVALEDWVNSGNAATSYVHPNHTGDVTSVGDGAQTITPKAVTNAKLADMAENTIKGVSASGEPQDLTPAEVRTILNVANGATVNTKVSDADAAGTTNDVDYLTVVKALVMLAARTGNGLEWDAGTNTIKFPVSVFNNSTQSWFYTDGGAYLELHKAASATPGLAILQYYEDLFPEGIIANSYRAKREGLDVIATGYFHIQLNDFWDLSDFSAYINDQRSTKKGLEYFGDYSSSFTARSLVDKGYADKTQIGTQITASKTFALTDANSNKITAVNSASAVALTIPTDATVNFPIGSTINIRRKGAGAVEIAGAVGVTIEGISDSNGDFKIPQYGIVSAYKEAANLWVVYGSLEQ